MRGSCDDESTVFHLFKSLAASVTMRHIKQDKWHNNGLVATAKDLPRRKPGYDCQKDLIFINHFNMYNAMDGSREKFFQIFCVSPC